MIYPETVHPIVSIEKPDLPMIMTIPEAAKFLQVSTGSMGNMTRRADADFVIVSGRVRRILTHKFLEWLERVADERKGTTD